MTRKTCSDGRSQATDHDLSVETVPNPSAGGHVEANAIEEVLLSTLRLDGGTQPRAKVSGETVDDYAEAMKGGANFPPVKVFFDGNYYWLADGFHRHAAAVKASVTTIKAAVQSGGQREAILFSVGANAIHGLRRTSADKRRAIQRLLDDPEWSKWSARKIADACGVDHKTVARYRPLPAGEFPQTKMIEDKDGNFYPTKVEEISETPQPATGKDLVTASVPARLAKRPSHAEAWNVPRDAGKLGCYLRDRLDKEEIRTVVAILVGQVVVGAGVTKPSMAAASSEASP